MNFKLTKQKIEKAIRHFTKGEWLVFYLLGIVLILSTLVILQSINKHFMVSVPVKGGELIEGIVGTPRFVNPILAYSDTDRDLTSIIYSGLTRKNEHGELVPDLAEKFEASSDGLTYTFTLKDKIYFHDGEPVTASDVIFTINKMKDPVTKSPRRGSWEGVSAEAVDNKNIKFTLRQPYASFLENTTLGILPEHLWSNSPLELNDLNINSIGSGPFMISKINKESNGVIFSYELEPFEKFSLGKPYLEKLTLRFYPNEDDLVLALKNQEVDQASSITPENAGALEEEGYQFQSGVLPRIFGIFFNQNQNQLFTNKNVTRAIDLAVDKARIVERVLGGHGVVIDSPIPKDMAEAGAQATKSSYDARVAEAKTILAKDGWTAGTDGFLTKTTADKNKKKVTQPLAFSISTGNAVELTQAATLIKEDLEKIGIKVEVKTYDTGNLNQNVIRARKYDALLFGQIINTESDLFAFWHSSQRNDPGLNVAMYTNAKVDKILEDAFITNDKAARANKYSQFEAEVKKDMPAVFLYSPDFIYIVAEDLAGLSIEDITSPGDRFANIHKWYKETNNVWKIFSPK